MTEKVLEALSLQQKMFANYVAQNNFVIDQIANRGLFIRCLERHSVGVNDLAVLSGRGMLFSCFGFNSGGSTLYIQIHDAKEAPREGNVPAMVIAALADNQFSFDQVMAPYPFTTGIYVCASTTKLTKTIDTTGSMVFNATYINEA